MRRCQCGCGREYVRWFEYHGYRGPVPFWRVWPESLVEWFTDRGARDIYLALVMAGILFLILNALRGSP